MEGSSASRGRELQRYEGSRRMVAWCVAVAATLPGLLVADLTRAASQLRARALVRQPYFADQRKEGRLDHSKGGLELG